MPALHQFLLILLLTSVWSPSFLFIKLGLQSFSPFGLVLLRVILAAILLSCTLLLRRQPMPKDWGFWKNMTIMALLSSVMPFSLLGFAGQYIESSTSAMINATTPVFTALLSMVFIPSEKLSFSRCFGMLLSLIGLFWLLGPGDCFSTEEMTLGTFAACLAAFSYGASHVYAKKFITGKAPFVAPTAQVIASCFVMFPLVVAFEGHTQFVEAGLVSWLSVGALAFLGTFVAFTLYYRLLEECGATSVSMVACFFPVGSMILGAVFLNEVITLQKMMAASLILFGGMVVNEVIVLKPKTQKELQT